MSANASPIFPLTPATPVGQTVTAANTAKDGTGTVNTLYTAGAAGGFVSKVIAQPMGTNVATVLRLFLNNGSTNATAGNNTLIKDVTLAATTNSEVAAVGNTEVGIGFAIPAGYKILATLGTAVSAGVALTCIAGDY